MMTPVKPNPERLLTRLQHACDALRWFLWIEKHQAGILVIDGKWSVSSQSSAADDWVLGEGSSLAEAMRHIEAQLAERRKREAERERFAKLYPATPAIPARRGDSVARRQ